MSPRNELEDWLTELPPLDGGDDDPDTEDGLADDFVPDDPDDASLDDAPADDLEVDEGVEITEEESAGEDDERWEADVGEPELDLVDGEPSAVDVETPVEGPTQGDNDLDLDDELPPSDDDEGEEGTTDPIEHSLDEDLPALDADEEGDFEDALLLEVGIAPTPSKRWADVLWEERSSYPVRWALGEDDVVVAMCLAVGPSANIVAALTQGGVVVASNGEPVVKAGARTGPPLGGGRSMHLALSYPGQPILWVATRTGELCKSNDLGKTWARCAGLGRPILALGSREDGSLSVLARKNDSLEILTSVDATRWFTQRVVAEVHPRPDGGPSWIAHRGSATAIGDASGVSLSRDGRHFVRIPASSGATSGAFAGRGADAPLLLAGAFTDADDAIHLVRVRQDGATEVIAEIKPPGLSDDETEQPTVWALGWQDATETLHIAFATHICAWGPGKKRS